MNKQNVVYPYIGYTKGHIFYDSIYMKYPAQANSKRQKADWLPEAG